MKITLMMTGQREAENWPMMGPEQAEHSPRQGSRVRVRTIPKFGVQVFYSPPVHKDSGWKLLPARLQAFVLQRWRRRDLASVQWVPTQASCHPRRMGWGCVRQVLVLAFDRRPHSRMDLEYDQEPMNRTGFRNIGTHHPSCLR